jgi:crotonobetainyl-CoA:carnitine CoA-transferase CaiB-like acyl-CoA transferase
MLPLEGIRVADFSGHASGPMCAMMLGDFGAEVIKIEPLAGDKARKWGSARYGAKGDLSSEYLALNRNKDSIALNLKTEDGLALAKAIIAKSDVVLENFKPGVMDRLGIGYEAMSKLNPRMVFCSISAFGQTGPLSRRPGFDLLMQAYAGALSITGEKGRPAVRIGPSTIDFMTGMHAVVGILLALRDRDRSGLGQWVDTSLYEAAITQMTHMFVDYTGTQKLPGRWGPYFPFLAPYGIFMAKDREIYIGASTDAMWGKLCEEIGRTDLMAVPAFKTNSDRTQHQDELYAILEPIFKQRTAQEWVDICIRLEIPHSMINDMSEVVVQEQALAREAMVPIEGVDKVRSAGIPIKLSRTPGTIRKAPPSLAEDTDAVLSRLGIAASEVKRMRENGSIK